MSESDVAIRLTMALAELKAPLELGEKVSVTDLAKKAGVSRKTIYSAPYCHFLDVLAKSVDTKELTSDSATQFELQISQLSHQLNEKGSSTAGSDTKRKGLSQQDTIKVLIRNISF